MWAEKYRPSTLSECFIPETTRTDLEEIVKNDQLPSMLFSGSPGIGKTTVAIAIANDLGYDFIKINGSMDGNIDMLRTDILQFASTVSFNSKPKVVILDEADNLSAAMQKALRGFIDEFSANCSFILTANYLNRLIEPLRSRLDQEITFSFSSEEKGQLAKNLYVRMTEIFEAENVESDPKALKQFIVENLSKTTDIRVIITKAQSIVRKSRGKFDLKSLDNDLEERFVEMQQALRRRSFEEVRKWVGENSDIDPTDIFRHIYDHCKDIVPPKAIPQLILVVNEYQYKHAFVADAEMNVVALMVEIMADCIPK
jgi:DNA polymerase III delta prime subunit